MYIPFWLLLMTVLIPILIVGFHLYSKRMILLEYEAKNKNDNTDEIMVNKMCDILHKEVKASKSSEISDRRVLTILKDEYETYWAKRSYNRILDFYNYAGPIGNKEKKESTVSLEFEIALSKAIGHIPLMYRIGDPTQNSQHANQEYKNWKKEGLDKFSSALVSLKTSSTESFVHSVLFGDNTKDEDDETKVIVFNQKLHKSEEKIIQDAIKNCNRDIKPIDISKMFARALLYYAEKPVSSNIGNISPIEGFEIIEKFMKYWGKLLLISEHQEALMNIALFMKGDFRKLKDVDSVVLSIQKQLIVEMEDMY